MKALGQEYLDISSQRICPHPQKDLGQVDTYFLELALDMKALVSPDVAICDTLTISHTLKKQVVYS